ncbi:type IV secretion system DNA-binding domain-containing protein, partial [Cysteiniphilum sp. 6C5]|uniref:type IV secretion system DNA-binding domain-containing protein n=1 Tax=unclassified Cysteiniphilum TaxID=2610889 RepID=UPI003F86BB6C
DKELNPLSVLCENWDIWKECKTPIEMGALATYLMPKAVQGSDPFWVDAARTIFASVAWKMRHQSDRNAIKLLQVLLTTSLDELRGILKGTEAENLVSKDIEKTAISIRAVMATYTKSLRFLEGLNKDELKKSNKARKTRKAKKSKEPFAICDWIQEQATNQTQQKGWLFITSRANFHAEIKPLISAWLGMALKSIQSLQPNSSRRVWVIMDEKASLNRLEGFSDIVADIRKFGGCVVLGLQSHSQVNFIYGRDEATAITDNMNTSVYFRSPKKQVAEWVSQDLGEHVLEEIRESQSYGPNTIRDGNTIARQRVTRRTVDTGTIMNLENLNCYVRLAGNHPITRLTIDYKERKPL